MGERMRTIRLIVAHAVDWIDVHVFGHRFPRLCRWIAFCLWPQDGPECGCRYCRGFRGD